MSQWCWAASISMLFQYYGFHIAQPRIVAETYGAVVNMPAVGGFVIARQVNRSWHDDTGRRFAARVTAAYDVDSGVMNLDNARLIRELQRERPVLIGTRTHAMVLTAMRFLDAPYGQRVTAVGVFDPYPGIGARSLSLYEATPMHLGGALRFAATVEVS
jgi:hypothetical protein